MIITNPTENDITIQYKGTEYSVSGKGSVELPKEVALYWKNQLHSFLTISEKVVKEVVKEVEKPNKVTKKIKE